MVNETNKTLKEHMLTANLKATLRIGMYNAAQHEDPEIRAEFWTIFDELAQVRFLFDQTPPPAEK